MKYIASFSGGKDSTASIILAHENNEPLDEVVYCEVMFDGNISGELPEHRDFIYNKAVPAIESWGYKVTVLRSPKTYKDVFYREKKRGNYTGKIYGFPPVMSCWANGELKIPPIREYWEHQGEDVTQYVGIAVDEPERMDRIVRSKNQVSLLQKYGYTEEMARKKCREFDLLSPIYDFSHRGGVGSARTSLLTNLENLEAHILNYGKYCLKCRKKVLIHLGLAVPWKN